MKKPISKQQLKELIGQKTDVILIDIRSPHEYENQHIPNAVNIPMEDLSDPVSGFVSTDTIVSICNQGHGRSQGAAELLFANGFENAFYLEGGTAAWMNDDQ